MMSLNLAINEIYNKLLNTYSYQGWWPIVNYNGVNPTKTGSVKGYHPKDYSFPRDNNERFEIILGSILTQNTSWPQVEMALVNLNKLLDFKSVNLENDFLNLLDSEDKVKQAIKPAGYFNQKYKYLKNITEFIISLDNRIPTRSELLNVKGVGNETCDSILLFAYKEKEFVVDAYTKRIFSYLNLINLKDSYMKVKNIFEDNFTGTVNDYQEYHGLTVEHAKRFYRKKPYGINDKLLINYKI